MPPPEKFKRSILIAVPALALLGILLYMAITKTLVFLLPTALVESGQFWMGCNECLADEQPEHLVKLNSFRIHRAEVTNTFFVQFLNAELAAGRVEVFGTAVHLDGDRVLILESLDQHIEFAEEEFTTQDGFGNHPAIVSWYGARAYCASRAMRLPTEAEWEYAARKGGSDYRYSGGDDADELAWHKNNANSSMRVALKEANELEVYDMSGNLREWVADWYDPSYYSASPESASPGGPAVENPQGPEAPVQNSNPPPYSFGRVLRGGSWREWYPQSQSEQQILAQVDPVQVRVTKRDYG